MHSNRLRSPKYGWFLAAALLLTLAVYWPGLYGSYLFDDYPNIVENHGVQPQHADVPSLVRAALSSPSSEFKRPLASLSFAANYLMTGLNPFWMKLTNVIIHLMNGLLVFWLARMLLRSVPRRWPPHAGESGLPLVAGTRSLAMIVETPRESVARERTSASVANPRFAAIDAEPPSRIVEARLSATRSILRSTEIHAAVVAVLIAASWMLLPINLTGVLYVVQRMESMANLFVLAGLIGYVTGRRRMLGWIHSPDGRRGLLLCLLSITIPTTIGVLAKETAVMLPLYAFLIEWILFNFRRMPSATIQAAPAAALPSRADHRITALFGLVLLLPMVVGLSWLVPGMLKPETWATRDFTMHTRLLSEARIVVDYIVWTLLPTPHALSFYHDQFRISSGLLTPWTTLASILVLAALIALVIGVRKRQPLVALGIALFLGCQLLTATIIPLELIYEHRNYFASFGLLLALIPLLAAPSTQLVGVAGDNGAVPSLPLALPRYVLLAGLMLCWVVLTAMTAYAWGNPLRLAEDLASRAPLSPRAQYELGRTYIIYSHYDPASPFTALAYAPLERSAALPDSSILAEQALIFMNSRMHLPLRDAWWKSMITKLAAHKPGVQDESSLGVLTQCMREGHCELPPAQMTAAYLAALSHPDPSARLLSMYGDYAWNILEDHDLGLRMTKAAVKASPDEPAYQITLVRMLAALGRTAEAHKALQKLSALNFGGRLAINLAELRNLPGLQ